MTPECGDLFQCMAWGAWVQGALIPIMAAQGIIRADVGGYLD